MNFLFRLICQIDGMINNVFNILLLFIKNHYDTDGTELKYMNLI